VLVVLSGAEVVVVGPGSPVVLVVADVVVVEAAGVVVVVGSDAGWHAPRAVATTKYKAAFLRARFRIQAGYVRRAQSMRNVVRARARSWSETWCHSPGRLT
jgi:hypothetical protein